MSESSSASLPASEETGQDLQPEPAPRHLHVVGEATEQMRIKATALAEELKIREAEALDIAAEARESEAESLALARRSADEAKAAEQRAAAAESALADAEAGYRDRLGETREELKDKAKATLAKIASEARERVDAARNSAREAQK